METTSVKHTFELNKNAISDMAKIFTPNVLSHSKAIKVFFTSEDKRAISVEYLCQPMTKLTFQFIGDGYVVIFNEEKTKTGTISVKDSNDKTARERVREFIMDSFDRHIFLG